MLDSDVCEIRCAAVVCFEAAAGDSEVVSCRQLHQRATIPEYIQTYRKIVFSSNTCGTMIGFKAVVMSPNHSHFLFKHHTWLSTIRVKCIFVCGEGPFKPTAL